MIKKYGVHLCIGPSPQHKRVVIHLSNCNHFKQNVKKGATKHIYSFPKNEITFTSAVATASDTSLEWHAPIHFCKHCFKQGDSIIID